MIAHMHQRRSESEVFHSSEGDIMSCRKEGGEFVEEGRMKAGREVDGLVQMWRGY